MCFSLGEPATSRSLRSMQPPRLAGRLRPHTHPPAERMACSQRKSNLNLLPSVPLLCPLRRLSLSRAGRRTTKPRRQAAARAAPAGRAWWGSRRRRTSWTACGGTASLSRCAVKLIEFRNYLQEAVPYFIKGPKAAPAASRACAACGFAPVPYVAPRPPCSWAGIWRRLRGQAHTHRQLN